MAGLPDNGVVRCPCGCGEILFRRNPAGDAIVIRCGRGNETEIRTQIKMTPIPRTITAR